ncbi:MAG TPA: hypothetical protein VFW80_04500 [Gaiellaceae bacterium]|nr:hypothetical protein [Gaiellaceae bacterium]
MAERPRFDPYELLGALERRRVAYILIGGFARVIQGTEELTLGIDIVPSMRDENVRRLAQALDDLGAERADGNGLDVSVPSLGEETVLALRTDRGELKVVPKPVGTRGYDDLRWHATGEHIGKGLRPRVASVDDLARMVAALGREQDIPKLLQLRHIAEFELSRGIEL